MHLNNFSCISLYIQNGSCDRMFINSILNSQPILIKFALKLFVCKCLSFQRHLLLDPCFPSRLLKFKRHLCYLINDREKEGRKVYYLFTQLHPQWLKVYRILDILNAKNLALFSYNPVYDTIICYQNNACLIQ